LILKNFLNIYNEEINMMQKIEITDFRINCIIGELEAERTKKQDVFVDIGLYFDIGMAIKSDRIEDTLDYYVIAKEVKDFAEKSSFHLIEVMASRIAELILNKFNVSMVKVRIKKPSALSDARCVSAVITLRKPTL